MKSPKLTAAIPALLLAASLLLSGCEGKPESTTDSTTSSAPSSTSTPASTSAPKTTDDPGPSSTAPSVFENVDLEVLLDKIYSGIPAASGIEFPSLITDVLDLSDKDRFNNYFGIDVPASARSAVLSMPAFSSLAYKVAILELSDITNIASIASSIESSVDPRKEICAIATVVKTAYKGNVILLIMDNDPTRANAVIEAFYRAMD